MKSEAWERFNRVALSTKSAERHGVITALIVDSPWLPGFMGISHIDYFTLPDQWACYPEFISGSGSTISGSDPFLRF